jgi:POT family proton-dependent oligopeptide transporter
MAYRTTALETDRMPPGIPWIIGNEAAERFSFYGMRTILVAFMASYLHLMDKIPGAPMAEAEANEYYHWFVAAVYLTPLLGALLADVFLGKFRTIMLLSVVYCAGHAALACMGLYGGSKWWLLGGLAMITLGSGGIKPCVSANVGDQFGPLNQHLLTKVYGWFYFSINLGSFFSTLLTPWLLEWYGPHWAFGVPGVLMAIATLLFWMGRDKFVHVPPSGSQFFKDLSSREGLVVLGKLIPLFLLIAMFWALYDQTGSSWVFQAAKMDRNFLGIQWLAPQIQAINPVLILVFIPLFTYLIYPALGRLVTLTPLRKIGMGFVLISASFGICAYAQSLIDAGQSPSIAWQILAYVVITAGEVMVSIVGLEFAYTQAPKSLKSMIMSLYLLAVFVGNGITGTINKLIQIPSAAAEQAAVVKGEPTPDSYAAVLWGYDEKPDTADDFLYEYQGNKPTKLVKIPGQATFEEAARKVESMVQQPAGRLPDVAAVSGLGNDPWGNPLRYEILDGDQFRLSSAGPDRTPGTRWDIGLLVKLERPSSGRQASWFDRFHPAEPWLEKRRLELGVKSTDTSTATEITFDRSPFSGGQTKLEGAAYYRFFMWLMLGTFLIFVPFSMLYKPRTYLQ